MHPKETTSHSTILRIFFWVSSSSAVSDGEREKLTVFTKEWTANLNEFTTWRVSISKMGHPKNFK